MLLLNGGIPVLEFDNEEKTITVLNNDMLPLPLIDMVKDTEQCKSIAEGVKNYDRLRTFFADRVLSLSREHAKQILESIGNSQKLTEEERVKLSLRCRAVSVNDNFWVKENDEPLSFADVNIRHRSLSDVAFQICMKGTPVSISHDFLAADISEKGMFRKTWMRQDGKLVLCKSDSTTNKTNTISEIEVSRMLDEVGASHIQYKKYTHDNELCCVCECMSDDEHSFIDAEYVKAYIENHGGNFLNYIKENFEEEFANMVVIDYCFGNPDEHINNWGFMVNSRTNKVEAFAPLFDYNQAMIIFETHKEAEFDELIYDPTGRTMKESVAEWAPFATIDLSKVHSARVAERYLASKPIAPEKECELNE